jgi:hypothetical protein
MLVFWENRRCDTAKQGHRKIYLRLVSPLIGTKKVKGFLEIICDVVWAEVRSNCGIWSVQKAPATMLECWPRYHASMLEMRPHGLAIKLWVPSPLNSKLTKELSMRLSWMWPQWSPFVCARKTLAVSERADRQCTLLAHFNFDSGFKNMLICGKLCKNMYIYLSTKCQTLHWFNAKVYLCARNIFQLV